VSWQLGRSFLEEGGEEEKEGGNRRMSNGPVDLLDSERFQAKVKALIGQHGTRTIQIDVLVYI
jgi:hypothetical protein